MKSMPKFVVSLHKIRNRNKCSEPEYTENKVCHDFMFNFMRVIHLDPENFAVLSPRAASFGLIVPMLDSRSKVPAAAYNVER